MQARRFQVKAGFHCQMSQGCDDVDGGPRLALAAGSDNDKFGFADTRRSVTKLNHLLIEALVREGVPAVGVSPFPAWSTDKGALQSDSADHVKRLLLLGFVPVLHGDAVLDTTLGCTILSGDRVMERLARALQPASVGFITDVAGVYDRPPTKGAGGGIHAAAGPTARLLPELWVSASGDVRAAPASVGDAGGGEGAQVRGVETDVNEKQDVTGGIEMDVNEKQDVTGGMRTKVECAARIVAQAQLPVYVAQVATPHSLRLLLGGRPLVGTALLPRAAHDLSPRK